MWQFIYVPFLHQQWEKMPKGKKENCELGLCQVELAMEFIRNVGFDRNVEWWKLSVYGIKVYWQHLQALVQNTNFPTDGSSWVYCISLWTIIGQENTVFWNSFLHIYIFSPSKMSISYFILHWKSFQKGCFVLPS